MSGLELKGVNVRLGGQEVLKQIDLEVQQGECVALLGPSGCGKTTTLRVIAGFVGTERGEVRIAGRSVLGTPTNRRNVGLVFQDYALFPHMTIAENVGYGLRMRGVAKTKARPQVEEALKMVQMEHAAARYPSQLSGGQRQRVALARALVIRPDILLLDEPLGALDRKLRDQMQVELKQLQKRLGITTIIVTHDQEEALSLADRVAVMFDGRIEEIGRPEELYESPRSRRVMEFLGSANLFPAVVSARDSYGSLYSAPAGFTLRAAPTDRAIGEDVVLGIRPEHVEFSDAEPNEASTPNQVQGRLLECVYKGNLVEVHTELSDGSQIMLASHAAEVARRGLRGPGNLVTMKLRPERIQVFAK